MLTPRLTDEVIDEKFEFLKEHFLYEIQQLLTGTYVTRNPLPFWVNIRLEIFLLHVRGLYEFFYNDAPKKYEDDAGAFEFVHDLERWKSERPVKTEYIINALKQIDKELAHLTYKRYYGASTEKLNTNDIAKINSHLFSVINIFLRNVPRGSELIDGINSLEMNIKACLPRAM